MIIALEKRIQWILLSKIAIEIIIMSIAWIVIIYELVEVAIVSAWSLRRVAYCKDFEIVEIGLREMWLNMRVEVNTCIEVKLLLDDYKSKFVEKDNEALSIFVENVRILEELKKIAVDFEIVEAMIEMLLSEYQWKSETILLNVLIDNVWFEFAKIHELCFEA